MEFEELELQLGPRVEGDLHVRVLRSPAGEGECLVPFPGPPPGGRLPLQADPAALGGPLFDGLFRGQVGELFHASLRGSADGLGLRLRLRINPRDPELAPLHRVPWELLYRRSTEDFLALSRRTPVVRSFDLPRPAALLPFEPPLRLLVVRADEPGADALDLDRELEKLRDRLARRPDIEVEVLENPDPQALRDALLARPFHALHYMGHGVFDPRTGTGMLLCRDPRGPRRPFTGRHLATKLKDLGSLRLVVLNACDTALAAAEPGQNPYSGVAPALVLGGVPAVVAMQSPIDDRCAIAFSAAFYDRLAHGLSIEEAVTEGRQAIHSLDPEGTSWAVPVLFLRTPTGALFTAGRQETAAAPERAGWTRLVAGAGLVATLAVGGGGIYWLTSQWEPGGKPVPEPAPTEPKLDPAGEEVAAAAATEFRAHEPESARQDAAKPAGRPAPPPSVPRPIRTRRTVSVGAGELAWRFEVTTDERIAGAFASALENKAKQLADFGLPGQTVSIEIPAPDVETTPASPLPTACTLSATCRTTAGNFTLGATRAHDRERAACEMAAEVLAADVIDRLANNL